MEFVGRLAESSQTNKKIQNSSETNEIRVAPGVHLAEIILSYVNLFKVKSPKKDSESDWPT